MGERHDPEEWLDLDDPDTTALLDDDGDAASDRLADPDTPRAPRSRRRIALAAVAGAVALGLVAGAVLWSRERAARTPEAAVLAYAQLVADGDVEAATALVPVPGTPIEEATAELVPETGRTYVDPALLSDAFYAQARSGLDEIAVAPTPATTDAVAGDTVEVELRYEVDGRRAGTLLRVERRADTLLGLPDWRVVDSLAVPLAVELSDPLGRTVTIAGVPVASGQTVDGGSVMVALYPGTYEAVLPPGPNLDGVTETVRIAGPGNAARAGATTPVRTVVPAIVAPELFARLADALQHALDTCTTAPVGNVAVACPAVLTSALDAGSTVEASAVPTVSGVEFPPTDDGGLLVEAVTAPASLTLTDPTGGTTTLLFEMRAWAPLEQESPPIGARLVTLGGDADTSEP
ncbi:hypothetical protein C8046_14840 [Serinibacter arcticus]|uniref:Uncharacterized protein n=1 Tax=Serinibacter arcticus TaxID=1655435 RepID=A0A2U1ZXM3_9MICO|nr:hypothetical protein [Serinibacter arcticus]PWD51735.1 hypothetical protein C8046_14840 [Serinibacter arcticus]